MAGTYDIVCDQGATFSRVFTWQDSTGLPVNLTGYTARMQVRDTIDAANILLTFTTENGGITLGAEAGTVTVTATAATTASIGIGCFVYDLELINGATVYRLLQGAFTVDGEVTR